MVSAGFDEHASYVIPALEKVIQRAITDYDDIIIEGVHLVPGLIDIEQFYEDANISSYYHQMKKHIKKDLLKEQFKYTEVENS